MRRFLLSAWLFALGLGGCSFDRSEHPDFCQRAAECDRGERCVRNFCVMQAAGGADPDAGGGDAGRDASAGMDASTNMDASSGMDAASADAAGQVCLDTGEAETCYDGIDGSADQGICKRGERLCVRGMYTQCLGQVTPEPEDCNGLDDDCDGEVDEIDDPGCSTDTGGECMAGQLTCRGSFAVCEPLEAPDNEVCNGLDDDCDGEIDEVGQRMCYPVDAEGCSTGADGVTCLGLCHTGTTRCQDGTEECENAVLPEAEVCTNGGGTPEDEDCDGEVDETCPCTGDETRSCYSGPSGTEEEGTCQAGTQSCVDNSWGSCEGQTMPLPETCENLGADNDCDGTVDNVENLGDSCFDSEAQGQCRFGTMQCTQGELLPVCVGADPEPEQCDQLDHNCDGNPYDGIDFNSNETCGDCQTRCDGAQMCCGGTCRSPSFFAENPDHCGGCNRRCGDGTVCCQGECVRTGGILPPILLGGSGEMCQCETDCGSEVCCYDTCVDLDNDPDNCGFCGNRCTSDDVSREVRCSEGTCVYP